MEKEVIYKRSLDLLKEFLSETTSDERLKMISEVQAMNIQGPTFDEYLEVLQHEIGGIEWSSDCSGNIRHSLPSDIWIYSFMNNQDYSLQPPGGSSKKFTQKDSVVHTESFFFYYNCNMVEAQNAAFKFVKYKIPTFSYNESTKEESMIKLEFVPSGKFFQKDSTYELDLELFGFEDGDKNKQIIFVKCVAYFVFETNIKFDSIPSFFYKNAIAIVFPFIRSFISTLTLQANTGLLLLGLMNLSNLEVPLIKNSQLALEESASYRE